MLKVKLVTENNVLTIKEYSLQYPFSTVSYNDNITHWNLNSLQCKNLKGSFRLTYSYKVPLDKLSSAGVNPNCVVGDITISDLNPVNNTRIADAESNQYLLFTRRVLFYINEKDYSFALNSDKKVLPHFLLLNEKEAKQNIQFFISYEQERNTTLDEEEITFYLNLFRE